MRKIKPKIRKKGSLDFESPPKKIYPKLHIDLKHLPEAKKWELESNYKIALGLKMTGISMNEYGEDADFEIREIGILKETPKKKNKRYK